MEIDDSLETLFAVGQKELQSQSWISREHCHPFLRNRQPKMACSRPTAHPE
jgi:hypothetical protein